MSLETHLGLVIFDKIGNFKILISTIGVFEIQIPKLLILEIGKCASVK